MTRPVEIDSGALSPPSTAERQSMAREHFKLLGDLLDQQTFRHISTLGIASGWRCWEAGAGGTTVPSWLAQQVGSTGYVLATDIDTAALDAVPDRSFDVRRHDLTVDAPPADGLDLAHARLVLEHLPEPAAALTTLVAGLRPGGWLLLESSDPKLQPLACPDEIEPRHALANKLRGAVWQLMAEGTDLSLGRTLPRLLRAAGLTDVNARVAFNLGGSGARHMQHALITRARPALIAAGLATAEEIDRHLADVFATDLDVAVFPVVSAWARKPPRAETMGIRRDRS
ncbi:hypothetical protein MSIMFB_01322 [Mycobacterium simulans]|uniref:Methyltransferase n=1 Tax=Mycobacterium simulans TaxID=627089 RepID=A0A7Z7IHV2_9MYCO|nr:methyltransferase domain-containing protein [Mycobacterium simulans]SOJ53825.1 hypothetical protein MSIMFB_01322 [Mycobacterium simulans]